MCMKEGIPTDRGPVPEGYGSWESYDRWQKMLERTIREDQMRAQETQFIQDTLNALSRAENHEKFQEVVEQFKRGAAPLIKEIVGFKAREIAFPGVTYNEVVAILPRRGIEHADDPIQYNLLVSKVQEL